MSAVLTIKILGDTAGGIKALQATGDEAESMSSRAADSLRSMQGPALAASAAIVAVGVVSVKAASDQEQAYGALAAVFGESTDAMRRNAVQARDLGLSAAAYAQQAAVLGAALKNQGVAQDQLAGSTDALIQYGADLAAQFGGSTTDAVAALGSMLRGEMDPIERFGISLKASEVSAFAAANGMGEAEAKMALLVQQMEASGSIGAAGREMDTLAGASQRAKADLDNAAAAIGAALLPALAGAAEQLSGVATWVGQNSGLVLTLTGVVGGLAVAVLAVNGAMAAYAAGAAIVSAATTVWTTLTTRDTIAKAGNLAFTVAMNVAVLAVAVAMGVAKIATMVWTGVQWALNAALTANPIGLVVVAIAALVGALILAYNKSESFRNIIDGIGAAIRSVIDWIGRMIDKLRGIRLPDWLPGDQGGRALPGGYAAGPTLARADGSTAVAGGAGLVVNFYGPVTDPEGTARALRRVVAGSNVRAGQIEDRRW